MLKTLHDLQVLQPPDEETAQLVQQVVLPVASETPVPPMEVDGAAVTTKGLGQPATDRNMPVDIFAGSVEDEEREEEELVEETDGSEAEQTAGFIGRFRHPQDSVDEGDFTNEREQRLLNLGASDESEAQRLPWPLAMCQTPAEKPSASAI